MELSSDIDLSCSLVQQGMVHRNFLCFRYNEKSLKLELSCEVFRFHYCNSETKGLSLKYTNRCGIVY